MTSSKSTKRALITSALAILMCAAMLIGTTFAWFTDTASTGVNKIVSGNLKVDIIGADSDSHIEKLNFTKAATTDAEAGAEILWEPGCRYLTEGFRIANKGNLALKWKAQVNTGTTAANEGNFDLLDVIDFYLVTKAADGTETETALDEFTGNLKKTETSVPSALYRRSYAAQRTAVPDRLKFRRRHIPLKSHIPRSLKSQLSRVPFGKHSVFPAFDCKLGTLAVLRLKGDKISCVRVCVRISVMSAVLNERDVAAFCDDLCFDRSYRKCVIPAVQPERYIKHEGYNCK